MVVPLAGPLLIQGFWWRDQAAIESFRRVVRWFIAAGYRLDPDVMGLRIPIDEFRGIEIDGDPPYLELRCEGAEELLSAREWTPFSVRLMPGSARDMRVNIEFAYLWSSELAAGERNPIHVEANEMAVAECGWCHGDPVPSTASEEARVFIAWAERTFQGICDELQPDIAATLGDTVMFPPSSLMTTEDIRWLRALFVPGRLYAEAEVERAFADLEEWKVTRFRTGCHVTYSRCRDGADLDAGMKTMRRILRDAYSPGS